MMPPHLLFYPHLLHSLLLLLLFSFFIGLHAQTNDTSDRNCPSYICGGLNISYPFWKIDNSGSSATQFCGYEGFGINCSYSGERSISQITLGGDSYNVKRIYHDLRTIILADSDVPPGPNSCPRVRHGINLQTLPLYLPTFGHVNLSFHFNCTGCPSLAHEIPCFRKETIEKSSCVHVVNSSTQKINWGEYSCEPEVVTSVLEGPTTVSPRLPKEFGQLLLDGFELQWGRSTDDCKKCEDSRGRCGHNSTRFICFCSNGAANQADCKGLRQALSLKLVIGGGSALVSFVIIFIIYCILKPRSINCVATLNKSEEDKNIEAFVMQYGSLSTKRYKYSDIKKMTNSFKVKLGQGGFGQVFKGKLSDGRLVAVKVLTSSKANGQEFINEVASIGRTSHVNIVTLLGFCFDYKKRALVYEYMPNGSLEKFIHSHLPMETSEHLGIKKLYEIALGIACGLDYLHRGCNTRILHLDIKPHNILLDEDFCPKIADFGLAKLYSRKESIVSMLEARGTIGYIAPEVYNKNFGGVSHKSDVYSYGMLLLEMIGGRKNAYAGRGRSSEMYFPDWIYKRLNNDELLLDSLNTTEENDYARKMTIVGLWCIQPAPNQRPSIDKVIEMLEGRMEALEVPPKPFFSSPPRSPATIYSTSDIT